jgi:hypothetical protein
LQGDEGRGDISPMALNQALTQQEWNPTWMQNVWMIISRLH